MIEFTPEKIKEYLDNGIRSWRRKRTSTNKDNEILESLCYVDAFQSVRTSLFGEILPTERLDDLVTSHAVSTAHRKVIEEDLPDLPLERGKAGD